MSFELQRSAWGPVTSPLGNQFAAELFTVKHKTSNFFVSFTNLGATIVRVQVPGRNGNAVDINYGKNTPQEYIDNGAYFGATVGRVANRIAHGKFSLEGQRSLQVGCGVEYSLPINNGPHTLHGGKDAFHVKNWECARFENVQDAAVVEFTYTSKDGEEGYPGTLKVTMRYRVAPMELSWEIEAQALDKTTIANICNHAYWNLEGVGSTIDNITIKLNASRVSQVDSDCFPTGEILDLPKTKIGDLAIEPKSFSQLFKDFGDLDNNFFLKGYESKQSDTDLSFAAELHSATSGISMRVDTTEPCVQVYTGNFMNDQLACFSQMSQKHGAVCLETQKPPNSINVPAFQRIRYDYSVRLYRNRDGDTSCREEILPQDSSYVYCKQVVTQLH